MKKLLETIGIVALIVLVLCISQMYYHKRRNPVEHVVEQLVERSVGINIEDFMPPDEDQERDS